MGNFLPRKYNDPMIIGMGVALAVAVVVIMYMWSKPKSEENLTTVTVGSTGNVGSTPVPGGNKPALAIFWADWCGASVAVRPTWEKVAAILSNAGYDIVPIEATKNKEQMDEAIKTLGFGGYPSIFLFPEGYGLNKPHIYYQGQRTEEAILEFAYSGGKQ
jgi:thiol-disulfide isomerase/thioredoxin